MQKNCPPLPLPPTTPPTSFLFLPFSPQPHPSHPFFSTEKNTHIHNIIQIIPNIQLCGIIFNFFPVNNWTCRTLRFMNTYHRISTGCRYHSRVRTGYNELLAATRLGYPNEHQGAFSFQVPKFSLPIQFLK